MKWLFLFKNKKTKKTTLWWLNENRVKKISLINKRIFQFFRLSPLILFMFLDGYKSKVILSKCSLSYHLYKCMINILLCKKRWWISIRVLIKGIVKKAILYLWEKDEIVFLKNIPIINNTILVIYSIYTYFLCSSTYCSI